VHVQSEIGDNPLDLKVAIVEDDPRFLSGLETFFEHAEGFELAGAFPAAETVLAHARRARDGDGEPPWDLVLMDLELPCTNGIDATRELKRIWPDLPVVVLTAFEEPGSILEAICAGADGYLLKKISANALRQQLRSIVEGGAPLTAGVARTVLNLLRDGAPETLPESVRSPARLALTEREQEVLRCLVNGMSYKQIAGHLEIAIDTVRGHIRNVYAKLQVHSGAEAVSRAIRERLV
jgi:DNA-binding NarL/FixJ family response regulator